MGWLHATPDKQDNQRYKYCCEGHPHLVLPEIKSGEYIVELWQQAGLCKTGGMGAISLDWQDMAAFKVFSELNQFEAGTITNMSRCYVSGLNMKDVNSSPPYKREYTQEEWVAMERSVEIIESEHNKKEMQKLISK